MCVTTFKRFFSFLQFLDTFSLLQAAGPSHDADDDDNDVTAMIMMMY